MGPTSTPPARRSPEWFECGRRLGAALPQRPGVSARVRSVVSGGRQPDEETWWVFEDGRLVDGGDGSLDEPDLTVTIEPDVARALRAGELELSVGFMQGRVKIAGDMAKVLALLPVTESPEFHALRAALATEEA